MAFEVRRDAFYDRGVVEETLLANADVCSESSLRLFFRAERRQIASRGFGKGGEAAGEVEELGCGEGADEGGQVWGEERHA